MPEAAADEVVQPSYFEVALGQRACRSFTDEPVGDADLERILTAATHAPSAENRQPWVFVVVTDDELRRRLGELTERLWTGGARAFSTGRGLDRRIVDDIDRGLAAPLGGAPVAVVVCVDNETGIHPGAVGPSIWPAVQGILLASSALGYGSALTTLAAASAHELRSLLALPAPIDPVAVVPIGRPARRLGNARRRPLADVAHRDRYGRPW